jgi:hypothetical protein
MIPTCSHWLGHKFEGRYNEKPTGQKASIQSATPEGIMALRDFTIYRVYVRDVCVRCGHTIERTKP